MCLTAQFHEWYHRTLEFSPKALVCILTKFGGFLFICLFFGKWALKLPCPKKKKKKIALSYLNTLLDILAP